MDAVATTINYESDLDMISTTWLNTMNPDVMMWMWDTFAIILGLLNILSIVFYISQTTGLYLINKKLGEKHAWLSFIPLLQIYNYFTASKKSFVHYLVLPILAVFIGAILMFFTYWISLLIAYIYFFVMWVKLLHAISLRCGRWAWTTVWFLFVPFVMMPVVGYKLGKNTSQSDTMTEAKIPEEKVEL